MSALIKGIRKDFPETIELDSEGDREGLNVLECGRVWNRQGENVNNCMTAVLGQHRADRSQLRRLEK